MPRPQQPPPAAAACRPPLGRHGVAGGRALAGPGRAAAGQGPAQGPVLRDACAPAGWLAGCRRCCRVRSAAPLRPPAADPPQHPALAPPALPAVRVHGHDAQDAEGPALQGQALHRAEHRAGEQGRVLGLPPAAAAGAMPGRGPGLASAPASCAAPCRRKRSWTARAATANLCCPPAPLTRAAAAPPAAAGPCALQPRAGAARAIRAAPGLPRSQLPAAGHCARPTTCWQGTLLTPTTCVPSTLAAAGQCARQLQPAGDQAGGPAAGRLRRQQEVGQCAPGGGAGAGQRRRGRVCQGTEAAALRCSAARARAAARRQSHTRPHSMRPNPTPPHHHHRAAAKAVKGWRKVGGNKSAGDFAGARRRPCCRRRLGAPLPLRLQPQGRWLSHAPSCPASLHLSLTCASLQACTPSPSGPPLASQPAPALLPPASRVQGLPVLPVLRHPGAQQGGGAPPQGAVSRAPPQAPVEGGACACSGVLPACRAVRVLALGGACIRSRAACPSRRSALAAHPGGGADRPAGPVPYTSSPTVLHPILPRWAS